MGPSPCSTAARCCGFSGKARRGSPPPNLVQGHRFEIDEAFFIVYLIDIDFHLQDES